MGIKFLRKFVSDSFAYSFKNSEIELIDRLIIITSKNEKEKILFNINKCFKEDLSFNSTYGWSMYDILSLTEQVDEIIFTVKSFINSKKLMNFL